MSANVTCASALLRKNMMHITWTSESGLSSCMERISAG
nr:MAG TPA: hypothetical protein [Caudoviricetes sp.]